ncbi:MAG: tyrosine-type recombinase/integrase [Candidatus Dormibacteria bacterium]
MASIVKLPNSRYQVRYWGPDGKQHKKNFGRRGEAERFAATVETDKLRGEWIDPRLGKMTFAEWAEKWRATEARLRPTTRAQHESILANHILPAFGSWRLLAIGQEDVAAWAAELVAASLAPATVLKAYQIFANLMKAAVVAGRLPRSPCVGVRRLLPEVEEAEMRFLTEDQVVDLAEGIDQRYRAFVLLGAYAGLRRGELLGLRRHRVLALRSAVEVAEVLSQVSGRIVFGPPKSKAGRRVVTIPRPVMEEVAGHIARHSSSKSDLVFPAPQGGPFSPRNFSRRIWEPAVAGTGLEPLRIHDLRHTAVGFWIEAGLTESEIAARAGWRQFLARYRHILERTEERANDRLGSLFLEAERRRKLGRGG